MDLQFISHHNDRFSTLDSIRMALDGGCRWVQLRAKEVDETELEQMARQVRSWCNDAGATFIIDDHVELVKRVQADGVHLGREDMPVAEARAYLGKSFIIGGTCNEIEDIERHSKGGADYLGIGPFRFTMTKKKLSPVLGVEGYVRLIRQMEERHIRMPFVAIGGITLADVPVLKAVGVPGIAVSGAILNASDPVAEMNRWMQTL